MTNQNDSDINIFGSYHWVNWLAKLIRILFYKSSWLILILCGNLEISEPLLNLGTFASSSWTIFIAKAGYVCSKTYLYYG